MCKRSVASTQLSHCNQQMHMLNRSFTIIALYGYSVDKCPGILVCQNKFHADVMAAICPCLSSEQSEMLGKQRAPKTFYRRSSSRNDLPTFLGQSVTPARRTEAVYLPLKRWSTGAPYDISSKKERLCDRSRPAVLSAARGR